jgi:hypothetical protein
LTENPIVINDDDNDGDLTDRSDHTSHQMTVNDPRVEGENTDGDEGVVNSNPDDAAMLQGDDRLAIAISASFSPEIPEIPESDSAATLDEEKQLKPSM